MHKSMNIHVSTKGEGVHNKVHESHLLSTGTSEGGCTGPLAPRGPPPPPRVPLLISCFGNCKVPKLESIKIFSYMLLINSHKVPWLKE